MVRGVVTLIVGALAFGASVAAPAAARTGALVGETQISFGCPGPAREDGISCQPWHPFAHARFRLVRLDARLAPLPQTARVVVSDAQARFRLVLRTGSYRLTPLPQQHTRGGEALAVRVTGAAPTRAFVRFVGFPQMV